MNEHIMPLDELITENRNIKSFLDKEVSEKDLLEMINASSLSHSSSVSDPVKFINFKSEESREDLKNAFYKGKEQLIDRLEKRGGHCCGMMDRKILSFVNADFSSILFLLDAPVLLAAAVKYREGSAQKLYNAGILEAKKQMEMTGTLYAGQALQSFMLKAQEKGIGTCLHTTALSFISEPEKLTSDHDLSLICFIAAGYSAEKPEALPVVSCENLLITK